MANKDKDGYRNPNKETKKDGYRNERYIDKIADLFGGMLGEAVEAKRKHKKRLEDQ